MAKREDQTTVSTHIDKALAERFAAMARQSDGGTSAALRRIITEAVEGKPPVAPRGAGAGLQIGVRLKPGERVALSQAARERGTTPANWLRSLAIVHLARKPQWNPAEVEALRDLFGGLRQIGNNVNQIAKALNVAVQSGVFPPHQHIATVEAAEIVRAEMRRVVAIMTGNFDYWGLPLDERPTASPGAIEAEDERARVAEVKRRSRPRKRPTRFKEDEA
ncbi:plasmid mobilization relaxosome protein MobC [Sphingomonas sp. H160509]|uniref:plasmid mobilization protein n=1 Tax=Sphingomonas sp. H160509 TaxID=2955313 RepID=UPI002096C441|nr:plasmid mobilization relaxosome protein MobC [Sphingomonas sp. H160509]